MKALLILGVSQEYRPERWQSRHHVYHHLARGLESLGIDHHLYANPFSIKSQYLIPSHFSLSDKYTLENILERDEYTHAFIWGGRSPADRRITARLKQQNIKCIFGEAGWFPQSGHSYFSEHGTNAECKLRSEGLNLHIIEEKAFETARKKIIRDMLGFWLSIRTPSMSGKVRINTDKPILLPLQDQNDSNIILSSPFLSMSDFVRFFALQYPDVKFIARPHPRSPVRLDFDLPNLTIQDSKINPYTKFRDYGGVIGINSTTLLQFSLLGLPVCGIGYGIGSGANAYHDLDINALPATLEDITCDLDKSRIFYDFLIRKKQLKNRLLSNKKYLKKSYISKYFET